MSKPQTIDHRLLTILALALFFRLIFIPHPGFLADIAYWKWWTKDSAQNGLVHTLTDTGINYPPLYLTVMKVTGHVYSLTSNLNDDATYWDKSNLLFLFLIKLPYIAADLIIGYLIYWFLQLLTTDHQPPSTVHSLPSTLPLLAASLWLFNPGVIYDSALWGQTDSLGVLPILLAYILAARDRPLLAGAFAGIAFFLKAQSIPLILFLYLYLYLSSGIAKTIKSAAVSVFTGLAVTSPFLIGHAMDRIIGTIFSSVGYFPWASLYAFNLWWLAIKGVSFQFPDTTLVLGLLSFRTIGFTLFWSAFALLSLVIYKSYKGNKQTTVHSPQSTVLFFSASLLILSAFLFPTEIHERYLLPFFAFFPIALALTASIIPRTRKMTTNDGPTNIGLNDIPPKAGQMTAFLLLSLSWLLNLHFVMVKNYPENELPILSYFTPHMPTLSLWFSAANITLFLLLLLLQLRGLFTRKFLPFILLIPLIPLILQALPPALAKFETPLSLTSLKPVSANQGWGNLAQNKSVSGGNLSVYYFFSWVGLGTHANSQLVYDIGGSYKIFETDIGVDVGGTEQASVEFQIVGDGKLLARSGTMKKWQYPKHLSADVSGVRKLELIVTDGGDGINGDHADWLNPTLYK
jgi:Gpi18-like mannosyltransferase